MKYTENVYIRSKIVNEEIRRWKEDGQEKKTRHHHHRHPSESIIF